MLAELGVPPADVLRQAGLPSGFFDQEKIRVSTDGLFALYRGIGQASRDPAIGLKLGSEPRVERYDPIAIARRVGAVVSGRARSAWRATSSSRAPKSCASRSEGTNAGCSSDGCSRRRRSRRSWWTCASPACVEIARRGTGEPVTPKRLELRGSAGKREMYEAHFGCPAKLGARENTIVFAKADLDRPFLTHNADLFATVAPQLEAELKQALASKAIGEQVKGILKPLLAGRRPGIEDVARGAAARAHGRCSGGSTEDGATFQQLLQEARRELARHYLLHSSLELNDTAYLLGYEDAHSFFRAFHDWEGSPPGEWRARHAGSRLRPTAPTA